MNRLVKLGKVDYLNCYPIYYPIENNLIDIPIELIKGPPAELNRKFVKDELAITPASSIEYALNHKNCLIIPQLSISADGAVKSIYLFCKRPIESLNNSRIAVTTSSATSVVLLKILLKYLIKIDAEYKPLAPDLDAMMKENDAALLIGDDALTSALDNKGYHVYDLGKLWQTLTGLPMVYATWVVKEKTSFQYNDKLQQVVAGLYRAKRWQRENSEMLIDSATKIYPYSQQLIADYYQTIEYDLNDNHIQGLLTYYQYAKKLGVLRDEVKLKFWSE